MSAIHERRYRLQREREIAQRRVRETTLQYVERYENILNDLNHQGLSQYVLEDIQLIQAQLTHIRSIATRDAFEARELSIQVGQRIHTLPRLARQLARVEAENVEYERLEREREKQEILRQEHQKLQHDWQEIWADWTDKYSRNLALKELSNLKQKIFVQNSQYTVEQIQREMLHIKQEAEKKANKKRESDLKEANHEATKNMLEQLAEEVKHANLPISETQVLNEDLSAVLSQPTASFEQVKSLIQKADKAMEDESIRREMVKAVYESLQHAGFSVLKPKRTKNETEDIVIIQARRPSGNQAKFKIELDGKVRYEFDNYRGQSCKDDMIKVLPRLSEIYGVDLSDERVIWSNPDDEDQEMKPITPQNVHQR